MDEAKTPNYSKGPSEPPDLPREWTASTADGSAALLERMSVLEEELKVVKSAANTSSFQADLQALRQQVQQEVMERVSEQTAQIQGLQELMKQLQLKQQEHQASLERVVAQIEKLEQDIEVRFEVMKKEHVASLNGIEKKLDAQLVSLRQEVNQSQIKWKSEFEASKKAIEDKQERDHFLTKSFSEQTRSDSMRHATETKASIDALQKRVDRFLEEKTSIKTQTIEDCQAHLAKIKTLEEDLSDVKERLEELSEECFQHLEERSVELRAEHGELKFEMEAMKKDVQKTKSRLKLLDEDMQNAKVDLRYLREDLDVCRNDLEQKLSDT
mmetsp:Transcript_11523/g.25349  ORF Transcript_11523/g.25349 Transcript_11523/m.25349 type:complete len:327 (+) Transcript_11523:156-1136(+)|eukprot:CAMPEP_0206450994 /NCGR_PEP_ID=MMETSP0324_2-20121206/19070_1 /ASSEMBLY_ACC=CAM_ASM_000836 /TAXON_ID=2866 /ORGANISM="Crypthecodinium cohnii, Strain Seligo" /LENGTH=326 /DNA_ID=CAMNT_0053920777 /DNA_START=154 /DNA_END=1134 /DNA_ORIENTATION=-